MTYQKIATLAVFLLSAVFISTSTAEELGNRKEIKRSDLAGSPGMEVITSVIEFEPGFFIKRHFHYGIETGYFIQGGTLQPPGKEPITITAGTPFLTEDGVPHGGATVIGNETIKIFTVHIVEKGKPLYEWTK